MSEDASSPEAMITVTGASGRRRTAERPEGVDRYRITATLGAGGMGVVLAGYDPELDRRVAIKLLRSERQDSRAQARMLREAQSMARLSHPNVVQIYDVGVSEDRVFMAMEYVAGCTLRQWLEQPRTSKEVLAVFVAAGRGLAAAHAAGLVHRDFKPDNVLIADDGRVRVADFGIASAEDGVTDEMRPEGFAAPVSAALTSTGAVVGTPRYMAPEQHSGMTVGPAADQFSFCVALHEALFAKLPFEGRSLAEISNNVLSDRYQPPVDFGRAPRWLAEVVRRGLRLDPTERYADIEALLEALQSDPADRRRRRLQWSVAALTLGGSVVGTSWAASVGAEEPCSGGAARMDTMWGQHRERLGERLEALDDVHDGDVAAAVLGTVGRYADQWAQAHRSACEERRAGSSSALLHDAALACLDRRADALQAIVELLQAADASTISGVAMAATRLPAIDECRDRAMLSLEVVPPAGAEQVAAVAAARRHLEAAAVEHHAGSVPEALAKLDAAGAEAEATEYDPVVAEHALQAGRLAMDRMDFETARASLRVAADRALAAGLDATAAEAEARGIYVEAMLAEDPKQALARESTARALVDRLGRPPRLAALLANNVGAVHGMSGQAALAAEHFRGAIRIAADADEIDALDHAGYLVNLAQHTANAVRRDELFATAESLVAAAVGSAHYERLSCRQRRAESLPDRRRALSMLRGVCPVVSARTHDDPMRAYQCHLRVAELADLEGRPHEAREALDKAVTSLAVSDGRPMPYLDAQRLRAQAFRDVLDARPEQALEAVSNAEAVLEPKRALPWIALDLADLAVIRARAVAIMGHGPDVRESLTRAIATYDRAIEQSVDQGPRYRRTLAQGILAAAQ
ncbi:MAG: serine/threonine-protein kinase [Myxococcota bacterium]